MTAYGLIYKATCLVNGKVYIGQTTQPLARRMSEHKYRSTWIQDKVPHFNNAIKKHGFHNFVFEVLGFYDSQEELDRQECLSIDIYKSSDRKLGYNLKAGGGKGGHTQATKDKISKILKGKLAGAKHPLFGKHRTTEVKDKISKANTGKRRSVNFLENLSRRMTGNGNPMFGKTHAESARRRISMARKGTSNSPATGKTNIEAFGFERAEELRLKNSLGHLGQPAWNKGKSNHKLSVRNENKCASKTMGLI